MSSTAASRQALLVARRRRNLGRCASTIALLLLAAGPAAGQTDEIQVYDAAITEPGRFNLTLHNNFTPSGIATPAFAGAIVADKSFNGVPEWAYGVTEWCEAGLYLPLYSIGKKGPGGTTAMIDGMKVRLLFAAPHAERRTFFYGTNFEFSLNAEHWGSSRFTSEVRPIIGWHLHEVDVIFNPIFDTAYDGTGNLDFAPSTRIAYNATATWAVAIEEYADLGPVRHFPEVDRQAHQIWGVVDRRAGSLGIEAGVGFGLTSEADALTLKVMLSLDLNQGAPH